MPTAELIAENLASPQGLAFDADDQLFVAEAGAGAGQVTRISEGGRLTPFAETGGLPMGIAFDDSGDLFVAESGRHHLLLVSPDEAVEVYASQCHGRRFSGPRDLCFTHEGGVLFCDIGSTANSGSLFHCDLNGEVEQLAGDLASPAGLVLLDDAVTLFASEQGAGRIVSFELEEDGSSRNREVFVELSGGRPGSLLLDSRGMLLVGQEGVGICVVDPDGAVADSWEIPGRHPTGMTFGGIDFDQLFVSEASGAVYRLQLDEPGQRPFAGPRSV